MKAFRFLFLVMLLQASEAFLPAGRRSSSCRRVQYKLFSTKVKERAKRYKPNPSDEMLNEMRADIQRMKREAAQRLDALNEKLIVVSQRKEQEEKEHQLQKQIPKQDMHVDFIQHITTSPSPTTTESSSSSLTEIADAFERDMKGLLQSEEEDTIVASTVTSTTSNTSRHPLKLLEDTRWRLMLTIGRVPGTWMPKTWGVSGDKLRLKLEVELTSQALYEREDFFNGQTDGAKVLKVCGGEAYLSPSMKEGGRAIRVTDGGWRVCPNEGPLGTSILRYYVNVEEEARHLGSDVYLPKGRVYGTCGYFPQNNKGSANLRETYRQELKETELRYNALQNEMDNDAHLFSLQRFQRFRELSDLRKQAHKCTEVLREVEVKEPKKSQLRLSRDQSVGLTHEGGLCLRKQTGLSHEYHILGSFEVASIENRDHKDYRDALSP